MRELLLAAGVAAIVAVSTTVVVCYLVERNTKQYVNHGIAQIEEALQEAA